VSGEAQALNALAMRISSCRICVDAPIQPEPLPHLPRPVCILSAKARICIAGQAPGQRVHDSGIPFNDPSGDRLREWLGVDRATFYDPDCFAIVPMGFCFPGYNARKADLPPRRECAPAWRDRVFAAMPQVELLLCIGQYAQAWHMAEHRRKTLTETVCSWREIVAATNGPVVVPLPHPSWRNSGWLKRNPWFDTELLSWLRPLIQQYLAQES
jgi:uracil-DNA glycosylase